MRATLSAIGDHSDHREHSDQTRERATDDGEPLAPEERDVQQDADARGDIQQREMSHQELSGRAHETARDHAELDAGGEEDHADDASRNRRMRSCHEPSAEPLQRDEKKKSKQRERGAQRRAERDDAAEPEQEREHERPLRAARHAPVHFPTMIVRMTAESGGNGSGCFALETPECTLLSAVEKVMPQ